MTNISASQISRTLAAAGHVRSGLYPGAPSTATARTEGFTVKQDGPEMAVVDYHSGATTYNEYATESRENHEQFALGDYARVLREAGYTVRVNDHSLRITKFVN